MKTIAVVQARMGSTRFPAKIFSNIQGVPLLEFLLRRLERSALIDEIIIALPDSSENRQLDKWIRDLGFRTYFGNEKDVLERFYFAVKDDMPDYIVRITADCPFVDPKIVDRVIANLHANSENVLSTNTHPPTYPDGLDCSVFTFAALEMAHMNATESFDREHVEPYILRNFSSQVINLQTSDVASHVRLTVDERIDLVVVNGLAEVLSGKPNFSYSDIYELIKSTPELFQKNQHLTRNQGSKMSEGQKLYRRAKNIIPGGTMLFSKRAENFLPEGWPTYFSRAKGCEVWDLEGNRFTDVSLMGIGANTLGYGRSEVDERVIEIVRLGNMSTLNAPDEVFLAEKLIELHPWAEQVRFARSGGEVTSIAIRIARAHSGKDLVAFCGYHGWYDWYLAANLQSQSNLETHLMTGLESKGVPRVLRNSALPFIYNNLESFEKAISNPEVGTVIMEVTRNQEPNEGYLEKIREVTESRGIVLIFDECTSGFRETYGGLHKKYQVEPDMMTLGKAMGNGYAVTAVIGKRSVMKAAQSTFISSTFWTERIGSAAALKTLEVMEATKSWELLPAIGKRVREEWMTLALKAGLKIETFGMDSMAKFRFTEGDELPLKTLLTQEMLRRGYLATTAFNASLAHNDEVLKEYFSTLNEVFGILSKANIENNVLNLLEGPVCHADFRRLN